MERTLFSKNALSNSRNKFPILGWGKGISVDLADEAAGHAASVPDVEYLEELERAKAQLLVIGRDLGEVYRRERKQALKLDEAFDELRQTYLSVVETLAFLVEARDECTRNHLERCREYGLALAGIVSPSLVTPPLEYGFLLHDVGKVGIPEAILSKPTPLTAEELRVMRTHPIVGITVVAPLKRFLGETALAVIRHHHERFDGEGYPDRLKGHEIPIEARIFSVVDAFDAMTSDRPYRKALSFEEAMHRLRSGSGTQFDPDVVAAFEELVGQLSSSGV